MKRYEFQAEQIIVCRKVWSQEFPGHCTGLFSLTRDLDTRKRSVGSTEQRARCGSVTRASKARDLANWFPEAKAN